MFLKDFRSSLINLTFFVLLFAFLSKTTFAHVTMFQPQGGDILTGGSEFTIKWDIDEDVLPDENWDVRFSPNNGLNWKIIVKNLKSTTRQFNWRVPNINTTKALIEVIEDRPSGTDDGVRSGRFTIVKTKK